MNSKGKKLKILFERIIGKPSNGDKGGRKKKE